MNNRPMNIPIQHLDPEQAASHPAYDPGQHADLQAAAELERADPELMELLDETLEDLAACAAPEGLSDRVYAASVERLHGRGREQVVIGRVGFSRAMLRYAVAAVLMVGWTGIWVTGGSIYRDAQQTILLSRDLAVFQRAQPVELAVDDAISALASELDTLANAAVTDGYTETWADDLLLLSPASDPADPAERTDPSAPTDAAGPSQTM